ncbi:hypothetical protein HF265_15880 [Rhizobium leguminosarum]|uniref:hypothetical protein n=1 Tax=Rhizobium leguminosarum TaxID=384 RepID=UPI001C926A9D|nr:hypothetical protein [Rhizobium leguminosarum]MBY3030573.1 hypothetical protein [Rhizobium leguminosarum]
MVKMPKYFSEFSFSARAFLFVFIFFALQISFCFAESATQTPAPDLQKCTTDINGGKTENFTSLNLAADLCYKNTYNQALIDDFLIRRQIYKDQSYIDIVLLWMVVIITCSGVLLSGLQLFTSYRLASASKSSLPDSSEMSIETGKITLRSSIIGLFILSISLAFFIIFVYGVYTIKENSSDSVSSLHGVIGTPPVGGLGAPPKPSEPPAGIAEDGPKD